MIPLDIKKTMKNTYPDLQKKKYEKFIYNDKTYHIL